MSSRKRRADETIEEYRKNLSTERDQDWSKKHGKFLFVSKQADQIEQQALNKAGTREAVKNILKTIPGRTYVKKGEGK